MGCIRYTEWYAHKPGNATSFQQPKKVEKGREETILREVGTLWSQTCSFQSGNASFIFLWPMQPLPIDIYVGFPQPSALAIALWCYWESHIDPTFGNDKAGAVSSHPPAAPPPRRLWFAFLLNFFSSRDHGRHSSPCSMSLLVQMSTFDLLMVT